VDGQTQDQTSQETERGNRWIVAGARRYGAQAIENAPSARETMLLLGTIGLAAVGLVYAFSRNRQRWLNDTSNIDRRWDRPDRLADTWQEEERWSRRRGFNETQQSDFRSEGAGYGV
jgi:hypothetical protein